MSNARIQDEQVIEARVDRIMAALRRVVIALVVGALVILAFVLILELKREFQIDIFKGINFTIDDWYFDKVGSVK